MQAYTTKFEIYDHSPVSIESIDVSNASLDDRGDPLEVDIAYAEVSPPGHRVHHRVLDPLPVVAVVPLTRSEVPVHLVPVVLPPRGRRRPPELLRLDALREVHLVDHPQLLLGEPDVHDVIAHVVIALPLLLGHQAHQEGEMSGERWKSLTAVKEAEDEDGEKLHADQHRRAVLNRYFRLSCSVSVSLRLRLRSERSWVAATTGKLLCYFSLLISLLCYFSLLISLLC